MHLFARKYGCAYARKSGKICQNMQLYARICMNIQVFQRNSCKKLYKDYNKITRKKLKRKSETKILCICNKINQQVTFQEYKIVQNMPLFRKYRILLFLVRFSKFRNFSNFLNLVKIFK